jgi:hypothetical protein
MKLEASVVQLKLEEDTTKEVVIEGKPIARAV